MQTVKVKIVGFEEESGSLLVKFASDTTQSNDPESYIAMAYQPALMWPEATTNKEILENLGRCAISLVNTEVIFNVSELTTSYSDTSSTTTTTETTPA